MKSKRKAAKKAEPKRRGLTAKQEAFCNAYIVHGVGATAYRDAYDADGMKPGVVHNEASKLLDNHGIAIRIKQLQERAAARAEITLGRVLRELCKLAFLDIRKAFDEQGDLKSIAELDDETAAAIAGIEYEEIFEMQGEGAERKRVHTGRIHKIKLTDKKTALDSLAKHLAPISSQPGALGQPSDGGTWEEFLTIFRRKAETGGAPPT